MIEVEKKFILSADDMARLTEGAEFLGEKKFVDVYYDNADHALGKKDWWVRCRAGRFELKMAMVSYKERSMGHYEEIESEDAIKRELNIASERPLREILPSFGYRPFATIGTTRKKYKSEAFAIDIDSADFGYEVAEIELMVNTKSEMEAANRKIIAFAESRGLKIELVRGKVMEYLRRNDPEHMKALEVAWGVAL